jgi:predicted dehydrogenase
VAGGGAELRAGCFSRDSGKNAAFAALYGLGAERVYGDYEAMARQEAQRSDRLDFVIVATPNSSHYEICREFLLRGFSVACEKPLTVSAGEADELARIAEEKGLICCTTYTYFGNPFLWLMRDFYAEGRIGRPYYVNLSFIHGRRLAQVMRDSRDSWRFVSDISGPAGAVGDLGAHLEYLLRFLTGHRAERVLARLVAEPGGIELDSTATVIFEASGGLAGSMQIAQLACGHDVELGAEIWGDAGTLSWSFSRPHELRVSYPDGRREIFAEPGLEYPAIRRFDRVAPVNADRTTECFANLYGEFLSALVAGRSALGTDAAHPTLEDGARGVRFIEACVQSHREGNVWVAF